MASIQVFDNTGEYVKRINISYFGYGYDEFCTNLTNKYKLNQELSKEDLIKILSELEGRIGKKSSGLLLYYAFLKKENNFKFKLGR